MNNSIANCRAFGPSISFAPLTQPVGLGYANEQALPLKQNSATSKRVSEVAVDASHGSLALGSQVGSKEFYKIINACKRESVGWILVRNGL